MGSPQYIGKAALAKALGVTTGTALLRGRGFKSRLPSKKARNTERSMSQAKRCRGQSGQDTLAAHSSANSGLRA